MPATKRSKKKVTKRRTSRSAKSLETQVAEPTGAMSPTGAIRRIPSTTGRPGRPKKEPYIPF